MAPVPAALLRFKDEVGIDLSVLTPEERSLCDRAFDIMRKARILKI
jgi:hypothetical protein